MGKHTSNNQNVHSLIELEGKYQIDNFAPVKQKLSAYSLDHTGTYSEYDRGYDIKDLLHSKGYYFRLREYGLLGQEPNHLLTIKGPNKSTVINERLELEMLLGRFTSKLLQTILPERVSYRKLREVYPSPEDGCTICLDDVVGLGKFVEISAHTEELVEVWKKRLGINTDSINMSYADMARQGYYDSNQSGNTKSFHVVNDDICIRLRLFGEDVRKLLLKNSWRQTDYSDAEYVFINTCAFLKKAEDRSIKRIMQLNEEKQQHQNMVVFGCLPYISPERLKEVHQGEVISSRDIDEFVDKFGLERYERETSHVVSRKGRFFSRLSRALNKLFMHDPYFSYLYEKEKVYHLKISEGCLGTCSFCAEKNARGSLRSKTIDEVVSEFKKGIDLGYRIFSFNSDDTGVYGWDKGENIATLLERVLSFKEDFKLVLTEFNPWGLVKYKDELVRMLNSPKIVFITVPIQSGSDRILGLMRRHYDIEGVVDVLSRIREGNKTLKINTHIITGFPGETEEDFMQSYELIKGFDFNKVKVFEYSDRKGTQSYLFDNKILPGVIKKRRRRLTRLVMRKAIRKLSLKELLLNQEAF